MDESETLSFPFDPGVRLSWLNKEGKAIKLDIEVGEYGVITIVLPPGGKLEVLQGTRPAEYSINHAGDNPFLVRH